MLTKHMAELHIQKYRGDVAVAINRPAMVCPSYREPFPGWGDTVAAAGTVLFPTAMGWTRQYRGAEDALGDFVPVDLAINQALVQTVYSAKLKLPMTIWHSTVS